MSDTGLVATPDGIRAMMRQALALYRARFGLYVALVALAIVPVEVAIVALGIAAPDPGTANTGITLIDLLARLLLILPLTQGAVSYAVVEQLAGRTPTFTGTLRAVLPRASLLVGTVALSLVVGLLGLLALVVPGIVMLVWFQFVGQVVILENQAFAHALRRCRDLLRGCWWRTLGCMFAIGIVTAAAGVVALVVFSVLIPRDDTDRSRLVQPLVAAIPADILVLPFSTIALTLLYLRLRRLHPPQ